MRASSFFVVLSALLAAVISASAQNFPVTPASPTEFKKRDLGGSLGSGVVGVSQAKTAAKTVRFIAVSDLRAFESTDGKKIMARMLAFEDGDPAKAKRPLTLVKDGKIRLLVDGKTKANVVPLTRLTEKDQDYVKAMDHANQAAAKQEKAEEAKKAEAAKKD